MDSLVVQTAIGLIFTFATFALLISVLTEAITRFIGLRGEYLLRGVRTLVDSKSHFELPLSDIFSRKSRAAPPAQVSPDSPEPAEVSPDSPVITKVMNHPLIAVSADKGDMPPQAGNAKLTNPQRRKLPSYISGRSFSRALVDIVIPNAAGTTTMDALRTKLAGPNIPDNCAGHCWHWPPTRAMTSLLFEPTSSGGTTITWPECRAGTSATSAGSPSD